MINGFGILKSKFAGKLRTSIFTLVFVLLSAIPWSGCWRDRPADRYTEPERFLQERMTQDERAIRAASVAWSKAAESKDLEKSLSFFADAAILMAPKSPAVEGKMNVRKVWQQMLALPGPGLSFSAERVEVALSGDLAWERGTYTFTAMDKHSKTETENGTYVTIWKKQPDGTWKVVGDIHTASVRGKRNAG
jgi:uncharacterized protein (TIGR02246 family)